MYFHERTSQKLLLFQTKVLIQSFIAFSATLIAAQPITQRHTPNIDFKHTKATHICNIESHSLDSITKIDIDIILGGVPKTILSSKVQNLSTLGFCFVDKCARTSVLYFFLIELSSVILQKKHRRFGFTFALRISCLRQQQQLININYCHDIDR